MAKPIATQSGFHDTGRISLRYRLEGRDGAPVIVLLHEMGTSLESWDEVAPRLTPSYRILRYDLRGFGLSEKLRAPLRFSQESDDLLSLLDALDIRQPVVLVGSALGGAVSLDFAAGHADRVAGIVAIGPAAYLDPRPAALAAADRIEQEGIRPMITSARDIIYPPQLPGRQARMERFMGLQLATDPTSLAITTRMVAGQGFRETLPRIAAPCWLVATTLFKGRKAQDIEELAAHTQGCAFKTIATGHLAAIESPEAVSAMIRRFMTGGMRKR